MVVRPQFELHPGRQFDFVWRFRLFPEISADLLLETFMLFAF